MKIRLIIILLLASTCNAFSQSFGVQAGIRVNASGIEYPGVDISRKTGFEGGVTFRQPLYIKSLSIRTGLLYFMQEFSLKNDMGNSTGITYHFSEDNLKIPVTIEWRPAKGLIKPFLHAGLYASCAISGRIKDNDSSNSLKYSGSSNRFDYGAIAGIGVYLTSSIALNANYEYGFSERDLSLGDQFVSVKNRGCSIALNYLF
ncbi:opacity protein-like surface antigen [Dysgonomonas hofstadii]|uniref:Opacity protein-like surface antigen n=1 Tax=Dysgonomonas hofstadii TaxID=637886 RepID=A0A840CKZ0_9BACT|nr:porin family protein [Dysgonomonas hofstadii]MBB4035319.1 opacity protein-like surface antigen [Dysgonomonas hofstadii]